MGGVLIVLSTAVPVLMWADLSNAFVILALFALLAFAAIGFIDDYAKVAKRRNLGLTGKSKIVLQVSVSLFVGFVLLLLATHSAYSTQLIVPFFKRFRPDLVIHTFLTSGNLWPLAYLPFMVFVALVITGSSNAVNLTDGLDGLGDRLHGDCGRGVDHPDVCEQQFSLGKLPGDSIHPERWRIDRFLRCAGWRLAGFSLV